MKDHETFPNGPITEAVLEFRVRLQGDAHLGRLASIQEEIKDSYTKRKDSRFMSAGINFPGVGKPITNVESKQTGYTFTSLDGKQIVHARLDAFGFSRLKPYVSWKDFCGHARTLWAHYVKVARADRVTRVGLRYINRIELPLLLDDFKDYILTKPDIAPGLPRAVATYALQMVLRDVQPGIGVTINQGLDPGGATTETLPLIFDIDAFTNVDLAAGDDEVWKLVERLRMVKNEVFFKSLTEKAKELFR